MNQTLTTTLLDFIRRLTTAASTAGLYDLQHKQVIHLKQRAEQHLQQLFQERDEFTLMLIENRLVFDEQPLEEDFSVARLGKFFQQQGIAHLTLKRGITDAELNRLIGLLSQKTAAVETIESSEHLRVGQVELQTETEVLPDELKEQKLSLKEIATAEIDRFQEIYDRARTGRNLNIRGLGEIVDSFIKAFSGQGSSLLALAPLRALDEYSYTHSTNVCILNIAQAKMLGVEGQLLYEIGIAAMLHDIGKLFIPAEILQKTGALNKEEWALIQQHPEKGAQYLLATPGIPRLAVTTAYEHHMRYDQKGYPKMTSRWPQHICSQITAVSDFFDALRTHRSYSPGKDFDKVASIMLKEAGTTLHPQLTRNFLTCIQQLRSQPS